MKLWFRMQTKWDTFFNNASTFRKVLFDYHYKKGVQFAVSVMLQRIVPKNTTANHASSTTVISYLFSGLTTVTTLPQNGRVLLHLLCYLQFVIFPQVAFPQKREIVVLLYRDTTEKKNSNKNIQPAS